MIFLRSIAIKAARQATMEFPFTVPVIASFEEMQFPTPVTMFVGENGSGKSTLLEGIAAAANAASAGGDSIEQSRSWEPARRLARQLSLTWNKRTHRGFCLRAEDFFLFARKMHELSEELAEQAREFEQKFTGYALQLAKGAVLGQRNAIVRNYGEDLSANSHGESFLTFFRARFVPDGLYLLDEPETPLSPQRQLAFLAMLMEMVQEQNAQFIIATHSPMLLAFPEATIYSFDESPIKSVAYDELEHVNLTRDFLNHPERFLRHLS